MAPLAVRRAAPPTASAPCVDEDAWPPVRAGQNIAQCARAFGISRKAARAISGRRGALGQSGQSPDERESQDVLRR
jgi:hypothetical protein